MHRYYTIIVTSLLVALVHGGISAKPQVAKPVCNTECKQVCLTSGKGDSCIESCGCQSLQPSIINTFNEQQTCSRECNEICETKQVEEQVTCRLECANKCNQVCNFMCEYLGRDSSCIQDCSYQITQSVNQPSSAQQELINKAVQEIKRKELTTAVEEAQVTTSQVISQANSEVDETVGQKIEENTDNSLNQFSEISNVQEIAQVEATTDSSKSEMPDESQLITSSTVSAQGLITDQTLPQSDQSQVSIALEIDQSLASDVHSQDQQEDLSDQIPSLEQEVEIASAEETPSVVIQEEQEQGQIIAINETEIQEEEVMTKISKQEIDVPIVVEQKLSYKNDDQNEPQVQPIQVTAFETYSLYMLVIMGLGASVLYLNYRSQPDTEEYTRIEKTNLFTPSFKTVQKSLFNIPLGGATEEKSSGFYTPRERRKNFDRIL